VKTLSWLFSFIILFSCQPGQIRPARQIPEPNQILENAASAWIGTPYLLGGTDRRGIDCSALVQAIYREVWQTELPRTTQQLVQSGAFVRQPWQEPGDLLFFSNQRGVFTDHVGLYLGNNRFIHASSTHGVVIADLTGSYFQQHLITIRRPLKRKSGNR